MQPTVSSFGRFDPNVSYKERRAAYAVIFSENGRISAVKGSEKYFLPGGGLNEGESAEEGVVREIREELARGARLICEIGRAIQYFYAPSDNCHYKMLAVFFLAELAEELPTTAEHSLEWISPANVDDLLCHQCHAWAVREALMKSKNKSS